MGAVLYAAATLLVVQASGRETEPGVVIIPINESVQAKQPAITDARAELPPLPRPEIGQLRLGQWVEVAHYTAILRAFPGSPGHVLGGYPVGEPFRVLALKGDYVRVQDLGSGQLGWVERTALGPYMGGYRKRRVLPSAPQVEEPQATVVAQASQTVEPEKPAASSRGGRKPFALGPAPAAPAAQPVAAKTQRPLRVAQDDSLTAIMQRAFGGAH